MGGGAKGPAIKKKKNLFWTFFSPEKKIPTAIKLEGKRGVNLIGKAITKKIYGGFS